MSYLGAAAQDAVVGSLLKRGLSAQSLSQVLEPDRLQAGHAKRAGTEWVLAGRIHVVGNTYRVFLKWVRVDGSSGQEYLEVADLNQLLPQLESFARSNLQLATLVAAPALPPARETPAVVSPPAVKEVPVAVTERPPVPVVQSTAPEPKKTIKKESRKEEKVREQALEDSAQGFASISQRLPYEVRALAYADADGDGQKEVLLTSQTGLYVYRLGADGQLAEVARHEGKKLDNFVKVGVFSGAGGKAPWIVLTNLRGDQAKSKLLTLSGGQIQTQVEEIPYQLRAVFQGDRPMLLGEVYHARGSTRHQIYEMMVQESRVKPGAKLELPSEVELYSFEWIPSATQSGWDLVALTPSGKLKLFRQGEGKYKRAWTSRETYGGSANDVAVEVRDLFNEVVADYYVVPLGVETLVRGSNSEVVLAKNDMFLKNIIGRKPVATDGKMIRLKWDQLGFAETWVSKKVDGSILDYLVVPASANAMADTPASAKATVDMPASNEVSAAAPVPVGDQLFVAVRVRDQGLWEGMGRKDSVLLVYDLH